MLNFEDLFSVRSILVCEATGTPVTLTSTSATTSAKTGPSAGSITKMEPLDQAGMPYRLQIEFEAASGQDTNDMRFELVCRKRPNTNDGDWGSWYTVEDDMTKFGSPYLYDNLPASYIYHCAIVTKLHGLENDTRDFSESFACTSELFHEHVKSFCDSSSAPTPTNVKSLKKFDLLRSKLHD